MNTRLRVFGVALGAFVSTQGICAAASYELQVNENDPECTRFLNVIKESRIADMSNDELCDAITLPVTTVLPDSHFKELNWVQDPRANVALVAKNTMSATEPLERRAQFAKLDADWLREVMKLSSAHEVAVGYGRVQLTYHAFYLIRLTQTVCDASYDEHGPLPIFGFFSDPKHIHGVPIPPLLSGQLVYFDDRLATFYLFPRWIMDPGASRRRLIVTMQYAVDDNANGSLQSGVAKSCPIRILK
jgi:hypothetical protein